VNISASPYEFGKRDLRMRMLSELARKHGRFLVFVNQAGGNDELVFDGNSGVFAPDGRVIARAAEFTEDFILVELDERAKTVEVPSEDTGSLHGALVTGLGDYVRKSGFRKAVVGLSGGIDSAVTACIAAEALGAENVRGVSMPSPYSSQHSIDDARELARNLGIRFDMARIDGVFGEFGEALRGLFAGTEPGTAEENIQARIRGVLLMAISNKFGELALATGNKSEMSVGYCTLYGDMCGSLAVIGDVPKTKIYDLARYINRKRRVIPENTFTKPPSAELKPNQTDQDTLPPYDVLDGILRAHVEEAKDAAEIVKLGFDEATVRKVLRMIRQSEFKRKQAAPVIKVTTKAFGVGRRIPIVNGWK
jgi:NAD+ synthase (glutamine-hydrolysing)